jgi:hypothetical protein
MCSNPTLPHSKFRHNLSLFQLKKLNLGRCKWGLKFEHTFTGKSTCFCNAGSFKLSLQTFFAYFRVLVDSKDKQIVKSKINYKLGTLMASGRFAVDPDTKDPLEKYVAWSPDERIAKYGPKKFMDFCDLLSKLSRLVLQMARKRYFESNDRVEMPMLCLGCSAARSMAF